VKRETQVRYRWGSRRSENGQSMAEFAVILGVLMLLILGIVDLSRGVYARNIVAMAAREGARYGVTHPADTTGITEKAHALIVGIPWHEVQVAVSHPDADHIQVDVTYYFHPFTDLMKEVFGSAGSTGVRLHSCSRMRTE
jgi:hypothetical protein